MTAWNHPFHGSIVLFLPAGASTVWNRDDWSDYFLGHVFSTFST